MEVKQGPISADVFRVPAGYKKVESPMLKMGQAGRRQRDDEALVDTSWLAERLLAPELRVVDVRWYLDPARKGRDAYRAGHIPGAVFLDLEDDLSAPGGGRGFGRPPPLAVRGAGRSG